MEENTQEANTVETPVVVPVEANKTEVHDHTHDEDVQVLRKMFAPLHRISDKERRRRRLASKVARKQRTIQRKRAKGK